MSIQINQLNPDTVGGGSSFVSKSGDTMSGALTVQGDNESQIVLRRNNTTTSSTPVGISIGNSTADGTAGSNYGKVRIWGTGSYRTDLVAPDSTANRTIKLPDSTSTLATTDDVDTKVSKSGDTMSGRLTLTPSGTGTVIESYRIHTETASKATDIDIGNNIADGTAGSCYGRLVLFGKGSKYTIVQAPDASSNRTITLPNATGTIALLEVVYPVGSIYMSTVNTNPNTLFGFGTWTAWGTGKVPVGVDTSDTNFNTVEKTGGVSSVTLTGAQSGIAKHRHTINHGHSFTQPTITVNDYSGNTGSKSPKTDSQGSHTHNLLFNSYQNPGSENAHIPFRVTNTNDYVGTDSSGVESNGAHTHTVNSHNHSMNHGHTASASGGAVTDYSGNSGYAGASNAAEAHTNLQPYITCYMWKRTA